MLSEKSEWHALQTHRKEMEHIHMRDLFAQDPQRFQTFSLKHEGLLVDYSKHRITGETFALLMDLAKACDVESWRDRMFAGEKINATENRAVLHTALRAPSSETGIDSIHETLDRMKIFSDSVHDGSRKGHTGKAIKTVINIGIGGSDLGPRMVCEALAPYQDKNIAVRFVSNIDPSDMASALSRSDPETTLFIIASKSFTTQETMANAALARQWILENLKDENAIAKHFIAVSSNEQEATKFGIDPGNIFTFGDWVGGRYSLWSSVGLPICIAAGFENFRSLLDGAYIMDKHFREAPLSGNLPVILAMLGIWTRNFWDAQSHAILPYNHYLSLLPAFLQQLDMESNGKSIDRNGNEIDYETGPVIFGQPGTNGQHAFYQLIHQGTAVIPCDFIATLEGETQQHKTLLANMVAQSQALMQGRTSKEPHRCFEGNRPSTTILLPKLDPFHLGMLLALYEHKVFVQGLIWDINSFDQWGVELGKELTEDILAKDRNEADSSTEGILDYIRTHTGKHVV